jgi:hypothetical protein
MVIMLNQFVGFIICFENMLFFIIFFRLSAFDWGLIKKKRDAYIKRLNGIYATNLEKDKVEKVCF